jgi:(2R)-ethylmalonyl-CoA mutase
VQLPAWNEAMGLPRPWDQQWSLRLQQIAAFETDMLEYDDIFDGSTVIEAKVAQMKAEIMAELERIEAKGGAATEDAIVYMKESLVAANATRVAAIEAGDIKVIGVNAYRETEPSPLGAGVDAIMTVDAEVEADQVERLSAWRTARDAKATADALAALEKAARDGSNIMPPSIECAKAGVTTGEWADTLRKVFGQYRAPTGLAKEARLSNDPAIVALRDDVAAVSAKLGRKLTFLVAKPGLDGHSNGAEQIATRARECGMDAVYDGIRFTPAEIADQAARTGAHIVGLSILSGSHVALAEAVMEDLKKRGLSVPVIPPEDEARLKAAGIAAVYTPKDFELTGIMRGVLGVAASAIPGKAA